MPTWYRDLSRTDKRTFWGCFGGWSLDALDVQMFSFLIGTLIAVFRISQAQAGVLGTTTLVASAVGGWVAGGLADSYGRVKLMQVTVLWYAFFTFLSGFATSYEQLLITRSLQGLGFGGEWACGAVLMGEIIRPENRGKAVGCVQSGYAVGWAMAALLSAGLLAWLPRELAWRAAFWIGILPAAFVIFLRRYVQEPPLFAEARQRQRLSSDRTGALVIFGRRHLRTTILASLLAFGLQGSGYAIVTWLPTYMTRVRHLSSTTGAGYVAVVTAGSFAGFIASAYLSDVIGRRANFLVFSGCSMAIVLLYTLVPISNRASLLLGAPLGFFAVGIYSALGPFLTELFPTAIRASGQSFAYNFGRAMGALLVSLVGMLAAVMPLERAIAAVALGGYLVAVVAAILLPETRGMVLGAAPSKANAPVPCRTSAGGPGRTAR